jgi:hypothetical protein
MALWHLVENAAIDLKRAGWEWSTAREIALAALNIDPEANPSSLKTQVRFHCINDPTKKYEPSLPYRRRPLFVNNGPRTHGKRYRLLTDDEKATFLANPREDLENTTYEELEQWLRDPSTGFVGGEEVIEPDDEEADDVIAAGSFLLESHLQEYLFRHWRTCFPTFSLYPNGREFRTENPSVGVLDFLCVDEDGKFVVIETKRWTAARKAVGQILSYMGWVQEHLCESAAQVRGILIVNDTSDELRLAVRPVPGLEIMRYDIQFSLQPQQ